MDRKRTIVITTLFLLISLNSSANLLDRPESAAFDTLHNLYLISNYGQGNVIAIDTSGEDSVFLDGFGACYGNCIKDDIFYISNGSVIFGIDLTTFDTVLQITTYPAGSSDGLTVDTSGYLYVVDTGGRIFKISLSTHEISTFVNSGLAPYTQDVIFDIKHNRLLVAGYSTNAPIQAISLEDSTVTDLVYTPDGFFDGITMDDRGYTYVCSHGTGQVIRYDSTFTNPPEVISTGHIEPAGLDYNARDKILAVPNFGGDRVDFVNVYVNFEADITSGWVPFEVGFTGSVRDLVVDSWTWNFGDGEYGTGPSPTHLYQERGLYNVTLTVEAEGDLYTYTRKNYIIALADTLMAGDFYGDRGEPVEVAIYGCNTVPLNLIKIPVEYQGPMGLTLDSFSTAGCRTEYFDNVSKISSDIVNRRAAFKIDNNPGGSTPDLEPGEGIILKIYFTISPSAPFGYSTPIILDGYSSYMPNYISPYLSYTPIVVEGSVALNGICGDINNDLAINLLDITYLISYLYKDGPAPASPDMADVNSDSQINILDITYLIAYLYKGGAAPSC